MISHLIEKHVQKSTSDSLVLDFVNLQHDKSTKDYFTALYNLRANHPKHIIFGYLILTLQGISLKFYCTLSMGRSIS